MMTPCSWSSSTRSIPGILPLQKIINASNRTTAFSGEESEVNVPGQPCMSVVDDGLPADDVAYPMPVQQSDELQGCPERNRSRLIGRVTCAHILCLPPIDALLRPAGGRPALVGRHANLLLDVPCCGSPEASGLVDRSCLKCRTASPPVEADSPSVIASSAVAHP